MYKFEKYEKGFLLGADGQKHEVSEEIWTEYMRSVWCEEGERKRNYGPVKGKKEGSNDLPRVMSYERLKEAHGDALLPSHRSAEEEVVERRIREEVHDRLYRALGELGAEEMFMLGKMYLQKEPLTIRAYAAKYNIPRTTVQYQRKRLLRKLKTIMMNENGFSMDAVYTACGYDKG